MIRRLTGEEHPTVGIDPGTKTGVAQLDFDGFVQVETWDLSRRDRRWSLLLERLESLAPRMICVEDARQASFQRNRGNAARIFQAAFHAILDLYLERRVVGCAIERVPPGTLKKYATGNGRAEKADMIATAEKHLGLIAPTHDQADAAWLLRRGLEIRHGLAPMAHVREGRAVAFSRMERA